MANATEIGVKPGNLKVIGAGFGRTGTLSVKAALEELGFGPCYHMVEVFEHPEHVTLWDDARQGKPVDWHKLFKGYQATVDWPACAFYEALMQEYPEAKVVLTVRDPERWYESVEGSIYQMRRNAKRASFMTLPFLVIRLLLPQLRRVTNLINTLIWEGTFSNNFEDKQHAIAIFQQHIEEVMKRVPPEKLLVYNVKEGWGPLCAFLGVEVPQDKPFPHLNDRANFGMNRMRQRGQMLLVRVLPLVGGLAVVLILLKLLRRKTSERSVACRQRAL